MQKFVVRYERSFVSSLALAEGGFSIALAAEGDPIHVFSGPEWQEFWSDFKSARIIPLEDDTPNDGEPAM